MSKKLNNLNAYTLMELVIVVVIIGMMVAFAVPAFDKYGKNQAFNQKIEEVQALISQTQTFAKNPEKNVLMYEIVGESTNKFVLKRCFNVSSLGRCSIVFGQSTVVKEVALLPNEVRQVAAAEPYLACSTDLNTGCVINPAPAVKFIFSDSDVSSPFKTAEYTIKVNPFIISSRRF